jgi:integrase/ribosomal protein L40E
MASPTIKTRSFHSLNPAYLDAILKNEWMSADDISLILEFIGAKKEESALDNKKKHFGQSRERRVLQHLRTLAEFSPVDYRDISIKHMAEIMPAIEKAETSDKKPRFSQNTYRDTIAVSKMFLRWLIDNNKSQMTEKELKKIGIPEADEHTITADDLLTEEDRDAMIKACQNSRDRAIISLSFEAALRPVEIGRLTFKDLEFTDISMNVKTSEKTGRVRKIPAPLSKQYIKAWMNDLPYDPAPDAVVFCSLTPQVDDKGVRQWLPLRDDAIRRQIKTIAGIAGIKNFKKLYQFRHTAISSWINSGIPERMAMEMSHGGDTAMLKIYYHVTHDEVERRVLALNGIETSEPVKKAPTKYICHKCGTQNPVTLRFCGNCGEPLTEEARNQVQQEKESIRAAGQQFVRIEDVRSIVEREVRAALAGKQ